jgi:hydrogenase maturation protease
VSRVWPAPAWSSTVASGDEPRPRPRVVVAGLGSEYRRDDGAGPAVATRTVEQAPTTDDIGPLADPLDLLGRWDRAGLAIVIDAMRSGATPGTVRVVELTGTEVRSSPGVTSTHGISLSGVLRLAQAVDQAPVRVVVVGIEGDDFGRGLGLSPAVDAAIPVAVREVVALIKEVQACA